MVPRSCRAKGGVAHNGESCPGDYFHHNRSIVQLHGDCYGLVVGVCYAVDRKSILV